jgi:hypothetical protein
MDRGKELRRGEGRRSSQARVSEGLGWTPSHLVGPSLQWAGCHVGHRDARSKRRKGPRKGGRKRDEMTMQ